MSDTIAPTPLTDGIRYDHHGDTVGLCRALIPHANKLERDLAAAQVTIARQQMELDASCNAEELRQVRTENSLNQTVALKLRAERDRLLARLQEIADEAVKHHEHNPVSGKDRLPAGYTRILNLATTKP